MMVAIGVRHSSQRLRLASLLCKMSFLLGVLTTTRAGNAPGGAVALVNKRNVPSTKPEPGKRILFVTNFHVTTEINQMLDVADELCQRRGHHCTFVALDEYESMIRGRGYSEFFGVEDKLTELRGGDNLANGFSYVVGKLINATDWKEYSSAFGTSIPEALLSAYEPALKVVKPLLEDPQTKPDCIYAGLFTDVAHDLAVHFDIPLAINFASPLGHYMDHEDQTVAPDSFLWSPIEDASNFWSRFRKLLRTGLLMSKSMGAFGETNVIRQKHGLKSLSHPMENWERATVLLSWPLGIESPRRLSPLTIPLGFLTTPHDPSKMTDDDKDLERWLESKTGGVVFGALGSSAYLSQEQFDEVARGLDRWVRAGSNRGAIFVLNRDGQYHVSDTTTPSPDVRVLTKYANQKMVLSHPNTVTFITHGGLASVAEAVETLTPMLVMPFFGDQMSNSYRLLEAGVGLRLHYREENITADAISAKLDRLTTEDSFAIALRKHYQINARFGGITRAADVVEDMLLLGHLDHLFPCEDSSSFPSSSNADVYLVLILFVVTVVWGIYQVLSSVWRAAFAPPKVVKSREKVKKRAKKE